MVQESRAASFFCAGILVGLLLAAAVYCGLKHLTRGSTPESCPVLNISSPQLDSSSSEDFDLQAAARKQLLKAHTYGGAGR